MRLKQLALMRQEKLFGAHEIQRLNRDADETVAWIAEKDVVLSSDDYGRDLATVQTLQVSLMVELGNLLCIHKTKQMFITMLSVPLNHILLIFHYILNYCCFLVNLAKYCVVVLMSMSFSWVLY